MFSFLERATRQGFALLASQNVKSVFCKCSMPIAMLGLIVLAGHSFQQTIVQAGESPNIILILTDDQGWSQLSKTMDPKVKEAQSDYLETPNMTRLADEGMRFVSGYSPAPLCTPTRRCILCGTTTARSGGEFKSDWVPADHWTIPKALKSANPNYRCAHFGKWGEQMISTPEECGYDSSDGETGNITGGMPKTFGDKNHNTGPPHYIVDEDPKLTNSVTSRAIDFMKESHHADHPFYVQVSYYAQHLSVVTTKKMLAKYKKKGQPDRQYTQAWAAMMEELDNGVGALLDAVRTMNLSDNTYIFFTADNGGRGTVPGGDEELAPTNLPLTGAKHSLYEGGIRVPFIARGPGIQPGSISRTPVAGYDFLPTFYDLIGGDKAAIPQDVDGVSFLPLLRGRDDAFERPQGMLFFHRPQRLYSAVRNDQYKLFIHWLRNGKPRSVSLFDVRANPTEEGHDLMKERPEIAESMQESLMSYLESVDAEMPQKIDPKQQKRNRKKN
ncbi:N-acetylgalactosamine 6-sulfate sulfatase (GALNS) [Planctomycetales bacterium 10988]|nr:N-acetylgalactosamine 6-sulfate sulfatase (GALNS) [Planctomycetales bacterium 10988]